MSDSPPPPRFPTPSPLPRNKQSACNLRAMKKFRNRLKGFVKHPTSSSPPQHGKDDMSVSDNSEHSPFPPAPPQYPGAAAAAAGGVVDGEGGGGGGAGAGANGGVENGMTESAVQRQGSQEDNGDMGPTGSLPSSTTKKRAPIVNNPAGGCATHTRILRVCVSFFFALCVGETRVWVFRGVRADSMGDVCMGGSGATLECRAVVQVGLSSRGCRVL